MSENQKTTNMTTQMPPKQNTTIRMTQYATNRLVQLADSMGLSKSSYVELLVRQTKLGDGRVLPEEAHQ